ncbi:MAG: apolipoprotein N-acyltransferase [Rhodospirillaceae bacterium]|nr:apolipoprotein N-acyltransferase [Rhodospirillaceae bacterium]
MKLNISRALNAAQQTTTLRRAFLAFSFGAMTTTAMPPWHLWPILWITLPALLVLFETAKTKRSLFVASWAFGFGHFATSFAWIGNAFFVDSETFAALAAPAIGGLAAGFGLYIGCVALIIRVLLPRPEDDWPAIKTVRSICLVIAFAAVWALVEWWRGWFLTGLPWNPIGSVWVAALEVLQGASLVGVYGMSLFTVLAACASSILFFSGSRRMSFVVIAICHLPLIGLTAWGTTRLSADEATYVPNVVLRLVQPNIAQIDKWRPGMREGHVLEQVRMSTKDAAKVTHVLWAETAVPFPLNQAPGALAAAAKAAPENGYVLTGAVRILGNRVDRQVFNSFFAITPNGTVAAIYDKTHLVPFGEYMPLQNIIPLPQLTGGTGFTVGSGLTSITLPGLPAFSPLICYEVIFPGAVTGGNKRPAWLFNLTNDAWFGGSSGPHQHLAAAQLRAAEEGLPVVRVANTGISAVVDSYGRVIGRITLGEKGILDSQLPGHLPATLFSRFGHWPFLFIALIMVLSSAGLNRKHTRHN